MEFGVFIIATVLLALVSSDHEEYIPFCLSWRSSQLIDRLCFLYIKTI